MTDEHAARRPTLSDIAAAVGVSKGTVSKALNGRGDISSEMKERVLAAVAEFDYRPTTLSPTASSRRSIAVVFDLPASSYILGVLEGVLSATNAAQYDLLTCLAPERESRGNRATARQWVADRQDSGVVGIIGLTLSGPAALIEAAHNAAVPFVIVDPVDTERRSMVSVGSSNWAGARTATEHLIGLGHERIAWIGGPEVSAAARDRLYGYQAALDAAGLDLDPSLVRSAQFSVESGREHAHDLLSRDDPPTAIMAADDEIAFGVLATAYELGIRVPQQVSVTGFDDTPQAAWTTPPLTTVHQHLEGMGAMAVQTILAMVGGGQPSSRHVELATSLTVRDSTGPATGRTD